MKKLLLTTAFVGAFGYAGAADAANLQVNVGGFLDFQAGYTSDDIVGETSSSANGGTDQNEINFGTDAEVSVSVEGKADNGLEYGAVIELEADIDAGDNDAGGTNADKTYAFVQGGFGRVEMGGNTGAEEALSVNTSTFASGTGGVDGDFYRYTFAPDDFLGITSPDLALAAEGNNAGGLINGNEDATKVTYYSPRFSGFQAGVSFAPNADDVGQAAIANTGYENVWSGGVNYSGEFSGVGIKAAVTALNGDNKTSGSADLEGIDAGINLAFDGFTVGGSWGDWGDTFGTTADAEYFDIGLGYAAGPWSASVTYLNSEKEVDGANNDDEFDNIAVSVDYQLAPGLVPYVEASFFDYDADEGQSVAGDDENSGTVVLVGSELTF